MNSTDHAAFIARIRFDLLRRALASQHPTTLLDSLNSPIDDDNDDFDFICPCDDCESR